MRGTHGSCTAPMHGPLHATHHPSMTPISFARHPSSLSITPKLYAWRPSCTHGTHCVCAAPIMALITHAWHPPFIHGTHHACVAPIVCVRQTSSTHGILHARTHHLHGTHRPHMAAVYAWHPSSMRHRSPMSGASSVRSSLVYACPHQICIAPIVHAWRPSSTCNARIAGATH